MTEQELLDEFTKILDGEDEFDYDEYGSSPNPYSMDWLDFDFPDLYADDEEDIPEIPKLSKCIRHIWEKTGFSPITNETWYNCEKCGIAKENADNT